MGSEGLVEVEELGIPFREGMFAERKSDAVCGVTRN